MVCISIVLEASSPYNLSDRWEVCRRIARTTAQDLFIKIFRERIQVPALTSVTYRFGHILAHTLRTGKKLLDTKTLSNVGWSTKWPVLHKYIAGWYIFILRPLDHKLDWFLNDVGGRSLTNIRWASKIEVPMYSESVGYRYSQTCAWHFSASGLMKPITK